MQQETLKKIKASKKIKKAKKSKDEDSDYEALDMYRKLKPLPGQLEHCANEDCKKRFTVTPYSVEGPEGGLLCTNCGRKMEAKERVAQKKTKKGANGCARRSGTVAVRRRQLQSRILDGISPMGPRSLIDMCIDVLAKNIDLADDLGCLPDTMIDKIARNLAKRRLLRSDTLSLFTRYEADTVNIYDCSYLSANDIINVFQRCPSLAHLRVKNAIAFSNEVVEFLISRHLELESFSIHGANLITEDMWAKFMEVKGHSLKSFKVYFTDKHFGDDALRLVRKHCPNLERLKVYHNQKVTAKGVSEIAHLPKLKHLSLHLFGNEVESDAIVNIIKHIGSNLMTLSLKDFTLLGNEVLDAIRMHCNSLSKLRITGSGGMTDFGFCNLFNNWKAPSLDHIDFQKCRFSDNANPNDNRRKVGLGSAGFIAAMEHSCQHLRTVDVNSCRHISKEALEEVFAVGKTYPELKKIELSFLQGMNDHIVGLIFKACPKLHSLAVFGCFKVKDVHAPRGRILLGVPNAKGMIIEGQDDPS